MPDETSIPIAGQVRPGQPFPSRNDPPARPASPPQGEPARGDALTNSERIRAITKYDDLAHLLVSELLRRRFSATEIKIFLFVMLTTLKKSARWVTIHGGMKGLAAQIVTHHEDVLKAYQELTDSKTGRVLHGDRPGRSLRLRLNSDSSDWGTRYAPLINDDEIRALRRRVITDDDDLQRVLPLAIMEPDLGEELADVVLSNVLRRVAEAGADNPPLSNCASTLPPHAGADNPPQTTVLLDREIKTERLLQFEGANKDRLAAEILVRLRPGERTEYGERWKLWTEQCPDAARYALERFEACSTKKMEDGTVRPRKFRTPGMWMKRCYDEWIDDHRKPKVEKRALSPMPKPEPMALEQLQKLGPMMREAIE